MDLSCADSCRCSALFDDASHHAGKYRCADYVGADNSLPEAVRKEFYFYKKTTNSILKRFRGRILTNVSWVSGLLLVRQVPFLHPSFSASRLPTLKADITGNH